jgi:menaquinone-dependent protoporphyrinogen IX oxidase
MRRLANHNLRWERTLLVESTTEKSLVVRSHLRSQPMHKIFVPIAIVAFQLTGALHVQPVRAEASSPQTLNPYSEAILKPILASCSNGSSTLNLATPLSRNIGRTAQQLLDESFAQMQKQSKQAEEAIAAQVKQRLAQLQVQLKDKKKLAAELEQIEAVIATGQVNGQRISPEQIEFLKKSRDDLKKLSQDPSYVRVMAKAASDEELDQIRGRLTAAKQKADACLCVSTTLQKQYTEQEFLRRSLEEFQVGPAISKDWQAALQTCKAPKSN